MALTYEPIATTTLGSATSSITFNSIPSTYTDLSLIINSTVATANNSTQIQFNNDTANNYSLTNLYTSGNTTGSTRYSNSNIVYLNWYGIPGVTGSPDITTVNIFNYSSSTVNKTFICRGNNGSSGTDATIGLWRSTAVINSIKLIQPNFNFNIGSTFTLYGIKAA